MAIISHVSPAWGARFELADGSVVDGTYITEVEGQVHLYESSGRKKIVPRDDILKVDWNQSKDSSLERKAKRERARIFKRRQKEARSWLGKWAKSSAKGVQEPLKEIERELDRFSSAERASSLADAVCNKRQDFAQFALAQLRKGEDRRTIIALVRGSLQSVQGEQRAEAHKIAFAKNSELTRQLYEYVVLSPADLSLREAALAQLVSLKDPRSVPQLVRTLASVDAQIRAYVVRTKEIKEVPVSFGAARNVTIDLPEAEILGVSVNSRIPVATLRRVHRATAVALNEITGETYGDDIRAWERWWKARLEKQKRDESKPR